MIRIAAVGDLHFGVESEGSFRSHLPDLRARADVLLLAGDLTHVGRPDEAKVVAAEMGDAGVPVVAVLGNHDHHSDGAREVVRLLVDAGVTVLEGDAVTIETPGGRVGIGGCKGFGGGFPGASGSNFGEPEMRAFMAHSEAVAASLHEALDSVDDDVDVKVALTHYAPTGDTLRGERLEIYPFLGSFLLGEAIDDAHVDIAFHGHAHRGFEKGSTPGGTAVRNVAQPVIRRSFAIVEFESSDL